MKELQVAYHHESFEEAVGGGGAKERQLVSVASVQ